ncbi:hypothetical protein BDQ94DRAFT_148700 [Aspergillus welwitschiae]|uniref:Uncharacterized protein n=2 Tax=Aspergillus subgen. Circumdati TaxID=2720871 RepID=A0A3F3PUP1_9EURO|nr:hypothetical protein BDQ94DRAFT_148700 [Aspergillus welwitschiae]RDH30548.1 hypothetical protein BDQ94DRAFT_148700 [Aspergillus welwitschiae]
MCDIRWGSLWGLSSCASPSPVFISSAACPQHSGTYLPSVNNWFTIQCFPPQATTPTQPQYYYTTHCFVSSTIDIPPTTVSTKE